MGESPDPTMQRIDDATMSGGTAKGTLEEVEVVADCVLQNVDFNGADLSGTVFHRTTFSQCEFGGAKTGGAKFTACAFEACEGLRDLQEGAAMWKDVLTADEAETYI